MKFYDSLTKLYKNIQKKDLYVYIENDGNSYNVVSQKGHHNIHRFLSKEDAIDFCKYLELKILAYVRYK